MQSCYHGHNPTSFWWPFGRLVLVIINREYHFQNHVWINAKKKFASVLKLFDYSACVCVCVWFFRSILFRRSLLKIITKRIQLKQEKLVQLSEVRPTKKNTNILEPPNHSAEMKTTQSIYLPPKAPNLWGAFQAVSWLYRYVFDVFFPKNCWVSLTKNCFPHGSIGVTGEASGGGQKGKRASRHTPPMPPPSRNKALHGPSLNKAQPLLTPKCC